MNTRITNHKDLIVWQKAMDLVVSVYTLTELFPKTEQYGLVSQMRRAAVSVPSNIAEGYRRGSRKEYRNFLLIAFGSSSELETQLEIALRTKLIKVQDAQKAMKLLEEVMKILNTITHKLQ